MSTPETATHVLLRPVMRFFGNRELPQDLGLIREVVRSPHVEINMFGGTECKAAFDLFTSRHPKFPLVRLKTFGAAVRSLDGDSESLFAGRSFELMRRKVRRSEKLGYVVEEIDPHARLDEILRINRSAGQRQGKAIASSYTDEHIVAAYHRSPGPWFGVLDRDRRLRAYAHTPVLGDLFLYSRILGDADHLNDGVMYLLVNRTTLHMQQRLCETGAPHWAMYDMYLGGLDGLREFKKRTGFHPARVTWRWVGST